MTTDEIRDAFAALIDDLADLAEGESRAIADAAASEIEAVARAGATPEMLETARNVVAHQVAQSAIRASAEAQARITNVAVFAIRLLAGSV